MFRKTSPDKQGSIFSNVADMLNGKARKQFESPDAWHNAFWKEVVCRVDESIFSVLFDESMGAPNASIRTLISMMILKEGQGWSDSQLFEQCQYNLLVRKALGQINLDDAVPVESTYYLLRKKINDYCKEKDIDLIEKAFQGITKGQVIEYMVGGKSIRMDSKLIGSNIAWCTRYELIHQTISHFCHKSEQKLKGLLSEKEQEQITAICNEKGEKVVYRSTREEIQKRLMELGLLMYKLTQIFDDSAGERYAILTRVFNEQYRIESELVVLRPKEELSAKNVQSPHDTDCTYRKKDEQEVKGYAVNITETCDEGSLHLITDAQVENAGTPDGDFMGPAIINTVEVLGHTPKNIHTDGAYQNPENDSFFDIVGVNFYPTGMQGAPGRYDTKMTDEGLVVTDRKTGETLPCEKTKSGNWRIDIDGKHKYFTQEQIESCERRRAIEELPVEIKNIRNNVESAIFQLSFHTRNNKTRYRGIIKHKLWAVMRCLWINFRRIVIWVGAMCPKTQKNGLFQAFLFAFPVIWILTQLFHRLLTPKAIVLKRKPGFSFQT